MGGVLPGGVSALGVSGLQMLMRSSHIQPGGCGYSHMGDPLVSGSSVAGGLAASISSGGLAAHAYPSSLHAAYVDRSVAVANAMSSDVRTQQLAAGLYSQMEQFYARTGASGYGTTSGHGAPDLEEARAGPSGLGMHPSAPGGIGAGGMSLGNPLRRLSPLVGTEPGDYELAPPTPGDYEMRSVTAAAAPSSQGQPPMSGYVPQQGI